MEVKRTRITDENANEWRNICRSIVESSYEVLGDIPRGDLFVGSLISYLEDDQGVYSFFVTSPSTLKIDGESIPYTYLGLSGTVHGERSRGKRTQCVEDSFMYLRQNHSGEYAIAICGTSPTLALAETVSQRVMPSARATPTAHERALVRQFGSQFLQRVAKTSDPDFVFRQASASRFAFDEWERQTSPKYHHKVFDTLHINERDGDRLVVLLVI